MESQPAQPVQSAGAQAQTSKRTVILLVILFLLIVAAAGFYFFSSQKDTEEPTEKTVTGLERDLATIGVADPFQGVYPNSVSEFNNNVFNNSIFEGLGKIVNGEVKPALAVSWSNPDNTTWRFKLREGVKFHNGDSFTASDVKFSIDSALKNEWPSVDYIGTVKSVEVVDDHTIDIKTTSPDPVLLNRLVVAFVVSEKQFKGKKEGEETVGAGPYKFVSLDKKEAVLEANPNYYGGKPKVKKVVYKFFTDNNSDKQLAEALKKGEIDMVKLSDESVSKTVGSSFQVKTLADPFINFLWLDTSREKSPYVDKTPNPLKDKLVRQAIYQAIDDDKMIKEASLSAEPASQMVTEAIFGYNPDITKSKPNIEEAKKLMEKAGVSDGFSMSLDVPSYYEPVGKSISEDLAKIGITIKVKSLDIEKAYDKWFGKESNNYYQDASAYIIDYGAETYDSGEIVNDVLSKTGRFNYVTMGYSNSEIEKLAEVINDTFTPKERLPKLQESMVKVMEEMPMIPLFSKKAYYVFSNKLDWTPTAFGAIYPSEISGRGTVSE
jgi:peptide/nickel transport system substrate-binding protein